MSDFVLKGRDSSPQNENLMFIYLPPGHPRCRWLCFFSRTQTEIFNSNRCSLSLSVGRCDNFLCRHIASLWDCRYTILSYMGGGKRETLCTCHSLFHKYLVILNRAWPRESLAVPITEIIYFQTYWKTNMLNIKVFKIASSYSDTAVIHRY